MKAEQRNKHIKNFTQNYKVIKYFRKFAGLTQKELAERVGVDRSTIAKLEAGLPVLKVEEVEKIYEILKINRNGSPFLQNQIYWCKIRSVDILFDMLSFIDSYSKDIEGLAHFHTQYGKFTGLFLKNEVSAYFVFCLVPPISANTYLATINIMKESFISIKKIYFTELENYYISCYKSIDLQKLETLMQHELTVIEPTSEEQKLLVFIRKNKLKPFKIIDYCQKNFKLFSD